MPNSTAERPAPVSIWVFLDEEGNVTGNEYYRGPQDFCYGSPPCGGCLNCMAMQVTHYGGKVIEYFPSDAFRGAQPTSNLPIPPRPDTARGFDL